jgi:hypothetical protein
MSYDEENEDVSIPLIRSQGWELDCWLIQTMAAEKGIKIECKDYLYSRYAGKEQYHKNIVKHLLTLPRKPMTDRSHIIVRAGVDNTYKPHEKNNYVFEGEK